MTSAASVEASTVPIHGTGPGASPRAALQSLQVRPISTRVARSILEPHHYLHSLPAGTRLAFGVFACPRLLGALTLGVGPKNVYRLVEGATPDDCATLTRLWLSDDLPANSESRVLGVTLRALKRHTGLRFLVSYADPSQGHVGTIYQATNWVYTGFSEVMPLYDIGDGKPRHSRSLSHAYGTHSVRHFARHGVNVRLVPQAAKHRYIYFLDPSWRQRLMAAAKPYPRRKEVDGNG